MGGIQVIMIIIIIIIIVIERLSKGSKNIFAERLRNTNNGVVFLEHLQSILSEYQNDQKQK